MFRQVRVMFLPLAVCLVVAAAAGGGDEPEDESRKPTVGELLERIERLERDKYQMQDEIDELRTQVGDDWLTQQRAQEIRNLVSEVLTDADTRANLLQDGMTAGWDGHFFLASTDGRFRLQLDGLIQTRFLWNFHDQSDRFQWGFENTRTRMTFSGHVFSPDLTYLVRGDWGRSGGGNILLDAWIRYYLTDEWSIRVGQFKLPFNREELVGPAYQQAIERSLINESFNIGRSQGIVLEYLDRTTRFDFMYSDAGTDNIGGFNLIETRPSNTPWSTPALGEWAFTARYEKKLAGSWEQFVQLTSPPGDEFGLLVGIAGHAQRDERTGSSTAGRDEERWLAATADVTALFGGASLFGSLTYHYVDDPTFGNFNFWGLVLQGGTYFTEKLEGYARFEWGYSKSDFDFEDLYLLTLGANYYFDGHDVKLSADIGVGLDTIGSVWDSDIAGWRVESPRAAPQVVIRTQLQLLF